MLTPECACRHQAVKVKAAGSQEEGSQVLYDLHASSGNLNFFKMKRLKANRMPAVGCILGVNANRASQNQASH